MESGGARGYKTRQENQWAELLFLTDTVGNPIHTADIHGSDGSQPNTDQLPLNVRLPTNMNGLKSSEPVSHGLSERQS